MRVTITMVLACLLAGAYGHFVEGQSGYRSPQGHYHKQGGYEEKERVPSLLDIFRFGFDFATDVAETVASGVINTGLGLIDVGHDAAHKASKGIIAMYKNVKGDLRRLQEDMLKVFEGFGAVVQEGLRYSVDCFMHSVSQLRDLKLRVLEKLEKKLLAGDKRVEGFFNVLGHKVTKWETEQVSGNVGQGRFQEEWNFQEAPDFFQDDEVLIELNKLVEVDVLTQEDVRVITQQTQH